MGRTWKIEQLQQMTVRELEQKCVQYALLCGAYTGPTKVERKTQHLAEHCAVCQECLFGAMVKIRRIPDKKVRATMTELLELLYLNKADTAIELLHFTDIIEQMNDWRLQNGTRR